MRDAYEELKQNGQFPSPSGLGMKILVLTQEEDCSLDDIVELVQADPALTGRILKLATSVVLSDAIKASTVKEAAMRLGLRTVSNVALGFTVIPGNRSGRCKLFDYEHYWSSSLAIAVAAQVISRELGIADPAEAFTCGLLSKIGKLALASVHSTEYAEIIKKIKAEPQRDLAELEKKSFRIQHREVTAAMLADWGLPQSFAEASLAFDGKEHTEKLEDAKAYDLLRLLNTASAVANVCVSDQERQPSHWPALRQICQQLEVQATDFCKIFDKIIPEWEEWGELLQLPTNRVLPIEEIVKRSQVVSVTGDDSELNQAAGLRILAVDDDPTSLRLLVHHLQKAGHQVMTATNGKEALAKALQTNPQLVVRLSAPL